VPSLALQLQRRDVPGAQKSQLPVQAVLARNQVPGARCQMPLPGATCQVQGPGAITCQRHVDAFQVSPVWLTTDDWLCVSGRTCATMYGCTTLSWNEVIRLDHRKAAAPSSSITSWYSSSGTTDTTATTNNQTRLLRYSQMRQQQ
jgi:hypothetical protein